MPERGADPEATVYIPTLNAGPGLERCLEALREQTRPVAVVVADNGPGEGCAAMLAERFPEVTRVGFGRNLGFGTALNRAVAAAGSGKVILLNDDAVAEPEFAARLLERGSGAAMVAAVLVSESDPGRIDSAGVIADRTLMAFDYLSGEPVSSLKGAAPPLGPTGGAALFDRDAFDAVGGFDERIFLYFEDVDLALRMRLAGATCELAPAARATHAYSATLGARTGRKYEMTGWSRGYLLRRYGVIDTPTAAAAALGREAAICAGQLVRDRTLGGLRGRVRGWRAARGLEPRPTPAGVTLPLSLREALALRRQRHSG
ncbi:MAG: glycosyltransferase family 2 protein [Solirubrobacterales bacterium]